MPRGIYRRKTGGKRTWDTGRITALRVELPGWTGFALGALAVKIAVAAEVHLEILSPGRGARGLQRFDVQLPPGSSVSVTALTREQSQLGVMLRKVSRGGKVKPDISPETSG